MGKPLQIDLSGAWPWVNKRYYPLYHNRDRFLVLMGGAGSGKSVFAAQKIILRCMEERNHRIVVLRKVARTNRNSTWSLCRKVIRQWGLDWMWRPNLSDLTLRNKKTGSEIIFLGLDDVEKLKSFDDPTSIWIEEATELLENDLNQINLRLRGLSPHYKQIILCFNPISVSHWLKKRFWDNVAKNALTVTTTYRDNRFLDPEYIQELERLRDLDYTLWQIYAEGIWGVLKGLIYQPWPSLTTWPETFDEVIYGLDFGFNNPMALIEIGIRDREFYATEKVYQSELTIGDLAARMEAERVSKTARIYADSADPDKIEELQRAGWSGVQPANKGAGSVRAGIDLLKQSRVYTRPENANLNKELNTYKWREDKDGNLLDEPVKWMDHALDATRYGIHSHHTTPQFDSAGDAFAGFGVFSKR